MHPNILGLLTTPLPPPLSRAGFSPDFLTMLETKGHIQGSSVPPDLEALKPCCLVT